jgi:hypothetical protein
MHRTAVLRESPPATGMPDAVVQKINADANAVLQDPAVRQALDAQGVSTSDGRKSPQFLPKVMVERKLATRSQIPALTDALYRLQAAGRVAHTKVGTYSNRTPKMGLGVA